jgi:hypothetical protein
MTALQKRQSDRAVINGQEFFRLFQELESGGDIYEINTSTKAICIGPQSDLSNYAINFFDKQSPDNIDEINLSLGNPVIGRIDALLATSYPTAAGLPANILISPRDLVNNNFVPSTFKAGLDFVFARPKPQIDIISYLTDPAALAPSRDDRLYSFPLVAALLSPITAYYILPYYGRRYGEFSFQNLFSGAMSYTINIRGINLFPGTQDAFGTSPGAQKAVETVLGGGSIVVPPGLSANRIFNSETDGMFDLISIALTTDTGLADLNSVMQLLVSDTVTN